MGRAAYRKSPSTLGNRLVRVVLPGMGDFETLAQWRQWLRGQGLSEATVRLYSYGLFRLLTETDADDLNSITEAHVTAFLQSLGKHGRARSAYFKGVRSFFGYCQLRSLVDADPTRGIRVRKPRPRPPVALSEEELTRYFVAAAWRDPRRAWALMLCFSVGARRMEIAAVQPEDIQGDELFLRRCKYGKTRRVPLGRYARIALEELRPYYNGTILGGVAPETVTEWAHQAAVDSGLIWKVQGRVAHVLRASFATRLLREGVPVEVVRDLMGHESIATTNAYAAVESHEPRDAMARLDFGGA
jgi:integrase/recombinase XerD